MSLPRPTLVGMLAIALSLCGVVSPFRVTPPVQTPTTFRGTAATCSRVTAAWSSLASHYTRPGVNRHRPQPHSQPLLMATSSPLKSRNGTPGGGRKRQRRLGHVRRDAAGAADWWVGEATAGPAASSATAAASAAGAVASSGQQGEAPPLTAAAASTTVTTTAAAAAAATPPTTTATTTTPPTAETTLYASEGAHFPAAGGPTFRELFTGRLPDWLLSRLEQLGFSSPTLVQRQALEVIMGEARSDAVLHAQTGSGKTLAFLLPFFSLVEPSRAAVQCLVVVPTRELGLQVAGVAKRLAAATGKTTGGKVQVMSVLEGSSNKRQRAWAWADPPHIVIGNPENLSKLVATGAIRVNAVSYVVVDEVDACLLSEATRSWLHELLARSLSPTHSDDDEGGDEEEAARLIAAGAGRVTGAAAPVMRRVKDRQTVFASATVPQHNHFIRQCVQKQWTLTEPVHVQVHAKEAMPPCLTHFYVVCPPEQKLPVLRALIKRELGYAAGAKSSGGGKGGGKSSGTDKGDTRGLVFALPTKSLEDIAASLDKALGRGVRTGEEGRLEAPPMAEFLREELGLNARADAMSLFREGKTRLLISTDMAARGLDVPEITHVFNLDLPVDGEGYVHRGGRAGRLGRPGKIISIVTPAQEFVIRRLGNGIGVDIKKINMGSKRRKPAAGE